MEIKSVTSPQGRCSYNELPESLSLTLPLSCNPQHPRSSHVPQDCSRLKWGITDLDDRLLLQEDI